MTYSGDLELSRTHAAATARVQLPINPENPTPFVIKKMAVEYGTLYLILCPEEVGLPASPSLNEAD
jgi:hypothetical protein